jgi:8-oxo-dGTP pyrophosphatase MutT (NUDIX family)
MLKSNHTNDVGRFMVGVGAVIATKDTGEILLVRRAQTQDFRAGEWEVCYGRMSQHEDAPSALKREHKEEVGFSDFEIGKVLRVWHMYRGEKSAESELIGITFSCIVKTKPPVILSHEHTEYQWVSPQQALSIVTNEGIQLDLQAFINQTKK